MMLYYIFFFVFSATSTVTTTTVTTTTTTTEEIILTSSPTAGPSVTAPAETSSPTVPQGASTNVNSGVAGNQVSIITSLQGEYLLKYCSNTLFLFLSTTNNTDNTFANKSADYFFANNCKSNHGRSYCRCCLPSSFLPDFKRSSVLREPQ